MIKRHDQSSQMRKPFYFNYQICKRRIDKNVKEFKERTIIHGNTIITFRKSPLDRSLKFNARKNLIKKNIFISKLGELFVFQVIQIIWIIIEFTTVIMVFLRYSLLKSNKFQLSHESHKRTTKNICIFFIFTIKVAIRYHCKTNFMDKVINR